MERGEVDGGEEGVGDSAGLEKSVGVGQARVEERQHMQCVDVVHRIRGCGGRGGVRHCGRERDGGRVEEEEGDRSRIMLRQRRGSGVCELAMQGHDRTIIAVRGVRGSSAPRSE